MDEKAEDVVFKKPKARGNVRKRADALTDEPAQTAEEEAKKEDVDLFRPSQRRKPGPLFQTAMKPGSTSAHVVEKFSASGTAVPSGLSDQGATAVSRLEEPDEGKEKVAAPETTPQDDGKKVYRGMASYGDYLEHRPQSGMAKGTGIKAGPVRASTNIRSTCRFDFQPDVCKDYKETGYCGFGDNCKFLHDRGDYKSGWQLEKEWELEQSAKAVKAFEGESPATSATSTTGTEAVAEAEQPDIPFACLRCKQKWTSKRVPVVTKCGHIFCEECLTKAFKKSTRCPYCSQPTGGFFNTPRQLLERVEQARIRAAQSDQPDRDDGDQAPRDSRLDRRAAVP